MLPLVARHDLEQLRPKLLPAPGPSSLPPPRSETAGAEGDRTLRRQSLSSSLRTQGAALFALLAIVVSGPLVAIGLAYRASDQTHSEQDAVQSWRIGAAEIDASVLSLITNVYLWNNAAVAKDSAGIKQEQLAIDADSSSITSRV
ncbi:MAG: hypothetical protein QOI23_2050, partial [Chloroflexota bacterium]|nr:hypothetical protein [Chloroflexota bacterium]